MASSIINYSNIADIKSYWLEKIAPNYFDMQDVNNYNTGIFGYVNEIVSNTAEDAFNAISVARREFYPTTAEFEASLFTMATLQSIEIPMVKAATCKCALILNQSEILENSTTNNGILECTIDSTLRINAGDIPFMIDYPIKVISNQHAITKEWTHIIHYDVSTDNSLNDNPGSRYISNKIINENGVNYIILFLDIVRQLDMTELTNIVVKDSVLDTITIDVEHDGDLANFEVFYRDSIGGDEVQLEKVLLNASTPSSPYVLYEILNENRIRLIFQYNDIFVPQYNSEIITRIYSSLGSNGNFNQFNDDVICTSNSEKYPYNSNLVIIGRINGSSIGGADRQSLEEFKNDVIKAYSTNNTITTSNDLKILFDDLSDDISNLKILFRKKRDDPFFRIYGAYILLKDASNNVVPTNTLTTEFRKSDFTENLSDSRIIIPAGTVFKYKSTGFEVELARDADGNLMNLLDVSNNTSEIYFTNPFMIGVNINPNIIGYYLNSLDSVIPIEGTYVNDISANQFIAGSLSVYRDSINGTNFYRYRVRLTPASSIDPEDIITVNDPEDISNQILAKYNGRVIKEEYYTDDVDSDGYVRFTIEYDTDIEAEKIQYIQGSNTSSVINPIITGYKMNYDVGNSFVAGNILATKRVDDKGRLCIASDIQSQLFGIGMYTLFTVQDYDASLDAYIMESYVTTNDSLDFNENLLITNGIYNTDGKGNNNIPLNASNLFSELNILYINLGFNDSHKYSSYNGMSKFTLTNTFISREDEPYNFIYSMRFMRSTETFLPIDVGDLTNSDFRIKITEVPLVGATWASNIDNYEYLVKQYTILNDQLNYAFYLLENNFSIDSKFYNTYGKSRYYTIGNNVDGMEPLDTVRCTFSFGVYLNTISSTDEFITSFKTYVKSYIENSNNILTGQNIYIFNLISDLIDDFSEISYVEYYGMNGFDNDAQKIIGPSLDVSNGDFIPEFISVENILDSNGDLTPNININILQQ